LRLVSSVFRNNGISFLSLPSKDHGKSAEFYHAVFGWRVRVEASHASFEDGTGHVIGHWEPEFKAVGEAGIVPFIYVDRLRPIIERLMAKGGQIVEPPYSEGNLTVALFRDLDGNVLGIWQQGAMDKTSPD
jgi:predicted enzyme related to lactoylglutathione lyase